MLVQSTSMKSMYHYLPQRFIVDVGLDFYTKRLHIWLPDVSGLVKIRVLELLPFEKIVKFGVNLHPERVCML